MSANNKTTDCIETPSKCSADQLEGFAKLVLLGGQVRAAGLSERICRASFLGFHYEEDDLAAIAALKQATEQYRGNVFRKSAAPFPPDSFAMELGWVFTRAEFRGRGISHRLLARLLEKAGQNNLFATTRTDNRLMENVLKSLGFQQAGRAFPGTDGAHLLHLWVRFPSPAKS